MTRDRTFPAGQVVAGRCDRCGSGGHNDPTECSLNPKFAAASLALSEKSKHRHAGCEDCVFLGSARLPAQSLRGMPNLVQLDFDLWYCPTSGGDAARRYRTVTARFDSEVQAFYTATYPLRTDTDYQRALREAAALAFKRGFV